MQNIRITRVNGGWYVEVGCQKFVFVDKEKMAEAFGDYMKDERAAMQKWCEDCSDNQAIAAPTRASNC